MPGPPGGKPDLEARLGLCARCEFGRLFRSGHDVTFVSCERSRTDPDYPRFPTIPMVRCPGFQASGEDPGSPSNPGT
jgi:hypothetical protein